MQPNMPDDYLGPFITSPDGEELKGSVQVGEAVHGKHTMLESAFNTEYSGSQLDGVGGDWLVAQVRTQGQYLQCCMMTRLCAAVLCGGQQQGHCQVARLHLASAAACGWTACKLQKVMRTYEVAADTPRCRVHFQISFISICGWAYAFMVTVAPVPKGQECLYDYGWGYCE